MELEHLNAAELAELQKRTPRPAAHAGTTTQPLRQLQPGLGIRALGRLIQAKYADGSDQAESYTRPAVATPAALPDRPAAHNSSRRDGRPLGEDEGTFFASRFGGD